MATGISGDSPATIHTTKDRPPKVLGRWEGGVPKDIGIGINAAKLLTVTGPLLSSLLQVLLGRGLVTGTPYRIKDVMLRMADGAKVSADVYFPREVFDRRLKAPTILIRTPYWKGDSGIHSQYFTQQGYVVVYEDIRGTGHSNSTSANSFLLLERDDGQEIINWIKRCWWYNGKIGTWGASYLGMTQYVIADSEDISCYSIQVSSPRNLWAQHNGLDINELSAAIARIQCDGAWFRDKPSPKTQQAARYYRTTVNFIVDPAANLYNDAIGQETFSLKEVSAHGTDALLAFFKERFGIDLHTSTPDPAIQQRFAMELFFGKGINRLDEYMPGFPSWFDYAKIQRPMLIISGWYDMFLRNSLHDFCEIRACAGPLARKYSKMVIGPWAHGAVRHPDVKHLLNGGLGDMLANLINIDWIDYWCKDDLDASERIRIEHKLIDAPPYRIFTLGRSKWRYEHEWPLARAIPKVIYLHSSGKANSKKGDGTLDFSAPVTSEQADTYIHDPTNPVVQKGGNNLLIDKGAFDQGPSEKRDDVLVYTSERLEAGIEITGPVTANLFAATTAVDTDFFVRICDVYPNGKSYNIDDLGIRTRYRDGFDSPSLLEPGIIYPLTFDLWPTSIYFKPGHRIRVSISSSDFPKYGVHSNLANGRAGEYAIAKQTVYHDADHPSSISVSVAP
jgi:hypothetical protein